MKGIAIFASGSGTNAQKIMEHFSNSKIAKVSLVLSNKADAFVLKRAEKMRIATTVFDRADFYETKMVLNILKEYNIDFIVLAGFLWLVPEELVKMYRGRLINIHPALLPKYGGKGMYGDRVHKAVIDNGESESGITIHHVNEVYDDGSIIFQAKCEVRKDDTTDILAQRIHTLEHRYYPEVVEEVIAAL